LIVAFDLLLLMTFVEDMSLQVLYPKSDQYSGGGFD
jgi:hypothetical protein